MTNQKTYECFRCEKGGILPSQIEGVERLRNARLLGRCPHCKHETRFIPED